MPPEAQALNQMASGLDYIHQCLFVHRDIKPSNVLISTTDLSAWNVLKISDFGFTKPVTERKSFSTSSFPKGTPTYMAPEYRKLKDVTNQQERRTIRSDVSIDVFSLGCLFYTYITRGKHAFATPVKQDEYEIIFNMSNGKKYMLENGNASFNRFRVDHFRDFICTFFNSRTGWRPLRFPNDRRNDPSDS